MDSAEMLALLARLLARQQTGEQQPEPLAARLCAASTEILGAEAGMLMLSSANERVTVRTKDPAFERIDDLQIVLGEGPVAHAFTEARTVVARFGHGRPGRDGGDPDTDTFPVLASMASALHPEVTVYAVPMRPLGHVVGVLTLYVRGGGLARPLDEAEFLADAVGAALLGDPETFDVSAQPGWPERARVHQATGIVTAQLGIAPSDALAMLRAHAFGRASSLDSVVTDVLERRLSFSYDDGGDVHPDIDDIVAERRSRTEEP